MHAAFIVVCLIYIYIYIQPKIQLNTNELIGIELLILIDKKKRIKKQKIASESFD